MVAYEKLDFPRSLRESECSWLILKKNDNTIVEVKLNSKQKSIFSQSVSAIVASKWEKTRRMAFSFSPRNDLVYKSLNYLSVVSTRLVYWLTSLVSIECLCTTLSLRDRWMRQPHIARWLMLSKFVSVCITDVYMNCSSINPSWSKQMNTVKDRSLWQPSYPEFSASLLYRSFLDADHLSNRDQQENLHIQKHRLNFDVENELKGDRFFEFLFLLSTRKCWDKRRFSPNTKIKKEFNKDVVEIHLNVLKQFSTRNEIILEHVVER